MSCVFYVEPLRPKELSLARPSTSNGYSCSWISRRMISSRWFYRLCKNTLFVNTLLHPKAQGHLRQSGNVRDMHDTTHDNIDLGSRILTPAGTPCTLGNMSGHRRHQLANFFLPISERDGQASDIFTSRLVSSFVSRHAIAVLTRSRTRTCPSLFVLSYTLFRPFRSASASH